eukprot:5517598-Lingulodinium_polyedra.AAC.1
MSTPTEAEFRCPQRHRSRSELRRSIRAVFCEAGLRAPSIWTPIGEPMIWWSAAASTNPCRRER